MVMVVVAVVVVKMTFGKRKTDKKLMAYFPNSYWEVVAMQQHKFPTSGFGRSMNSDKDVNALMLKMV